MSFTDAEIDRLEMETPDELVRLITEHFCTKAPSPLSAADMRLVEQLRVRAATDGLNYEQFNELLLLLQQNRVSRAFFQFFFRKPIIFLPDLKDGVTRFRGHAMIRYGNFLFARRVLTTANNREEIISCLGGFAREPSELKAELEGRPLPLLRIDPVPREETWLTGEITPQVIKKEISELTRMLDERPDLPERALFVSLANRLVDLDERCKEVQRRALRNTDVYLTWDYLDVYVATSMRNKWEFEETFDFVQKVFGDELLGPLKLRYFDPTQCKCTNVRDKGLLEGLMLKRAACTIYMAQESDTLGKDSELAATLAQGKPVIAYVPREPPAAYAARIRDYPLDFFKKRLLILAAEGAFDDSDCVTQLSAVDDRFEEVINGFLREFEEHRGVQPLSLGWELDQRLFKSRYADHDRLCHILAVAECQNFDRRSQLLNGRHPLSMQVNIATGTANGVLVVRSAEDCARVLHGVLTNELKLEIVEEKGNNGCVVLKERTSGSAFRVVTHNERLTNSFWNLFR